MDCSDWSYGIQYQVVDTKPPDTEFKLKRERLEDHAFSLEYTSHTPSEHNTTRAPCPPATVLQGH